MENRGTEDVKTPSTLSERQKAEYLDILDTHFDLGVGIMDEQLNFKFISQSVYRQLGITRSELNVGDNLSKCHDIMISQGLLTTQILDKKEISAEKQIKHNENGTSPTPSHIKLANGRTHELMRKTLDNGITLSISRDISELIKTDEMLDAALALGQSGYWLYDFATKHYTLSKSLQHYFSDEQKDIISDIGIIGIVHPEDRKKFRDALKNISRTDDKFSVTCRSDSLNGKERWSRTDGQIIRDKKGQPVQMRAFVKDVTHSRRQEMAYEKAKDDAIAASKAKSEFLANMSHEIRTPMNGVLGMAELLEQTDIDDRQRDYVKVITRSSQALLTIINDILDFSKIEAGAFELDPTPFDFREAIDDVMALLAAKAHEKNLELIVNYPPTLGRHFIGDAGRLRQVITNLVGNAIKFTQEGHILLSVDVAQADDGKAKITVSVQDTGIGIERAKIGAVFQQFTQADGSTTRVYGGTGLGLTISKRIVELMDGDISVASIFGEGSTFTFTMSLPIDDNAAQTSVNSTALSGLKVLIVDDVQINRDILTQRFRSWQMRSESVADGVDALVALKSAHSANDPFDLIVLDYLMPGMNGHELAAVITSNEALRGVPIVMLSSCDKPMSNQRLLELGIAKHVVKPIREKRLYEKLSHAVSAQGADPLESIGERPAAPEVKRLAETQAPPEPVAPIIETSAASELPNIRPASHDVSKTLAEIEDVLSQINAAQVMRASATTPALEPALEPVQDTENNDVKVQAEESNLPIHILVAEDFPLNQDVVKLMLQDSRYKTHFANNGQEAVGMFKANPTAYAAILMDISMPVMDGYEASEIIHAFQRLTGSELTPIIALTGHALKHDREKCLDSNMNDYLTKPVKQSELIAVLDKWAQPSQTGGAQDAALKSA